LAEEKPRVGQSGQGSRPEAKRCSAEERAAVGENIHLVRRKLHLSFA